jgi:hypothetical protein
MDSVLLQIRCSDGTLWVYEAKLECGEAFDAIAALRARAYRWTQRRLVERWDEEED